MKPIVTEAFERGMYRWCKCVYCKGPKKDRVIDNRAARHRLKLRLRKAIDREEF